MTLQKRLTIFTVTLTTAITVILGLTLVESTYRAQVRSLDNEINQISKATKSGEESLLSEALSLASTSSNNLSLIILDTDGELLPVLEQVVNLSSELNRDLKNNEDAQQLRSLTTIENFRIKSIEIGGGDKLLVVADLREIAGEKNRNYLYLISFLLISSFISLSLLRKVIARDVRRAITEIQTLDRLEAEKERNRFLREFIADASHELRTPLTVIKGYLELWKAHPEETPEEPRIDLLLEESNRAERNINSLLDFLEQETIVDETLRPINFSNLLKSEVSIFSERNPNREISESIDPDMILLSTDDLLIRLIRNVLGNIERHSDSYANVSLRAYRSEKNIVLQVENQWDNQSIDSLDFEKLTTRFNASRSFEKGGSGLGFNIMNGATRKMRGSLDVYRSASGDFGVKFTFPAFLT